MHRLFAVLLLSLCPLTATADQWGAPAGYYDAATGTGADLEAQLYDIMRDGHVQRRYGDFRYSAAIHDADPDNPGNILLAYDRASVPATWDSGSTWNREHVWPQSRQPGSASNSTTGNLGDPHALRPSTPSVNGSRGNDPYGYAGTTGNNRNVVGGYYFPGDDDKGDIARSLFYSATRYGPELGIELVVGTPGANEMGDLAALLLWHSLDPPDEFERRRNHTIYSQAYNPAYHTNNRNPYVDDPEFAYHVFALPGDATLDFRVDQADLDLVLANWGDSADGWTAGDFNRSGSAEQGDLDVVLTAWGSDAALGVGGSTVPEPLGVAALALLALLRRRPRGCTPSPCTA